MTDDRELSPEEAADALSRAAADTLAALDGKYNLWLDDLRPHPVGWFPVKTAREAIAAMQRIGVDRLHRVSLDHDLGTCQACGGFALDDRGLPKQCIHHGTGHDVVCWMEHEGFWPAIKPTVHSANPEGARRMRQVIDRAYRETA